MRTEFGKLIEQYALTYPVGMKTFKYNGVTYYIKCQNTQGSSNLAKLCREGKVDARNVGWVWTDGGAFRNWVCKYQIIDNEVVIAKPNEKLPCEM